MNLPSLTNTIFTDDVQTTEEINTHSQQIDELRYFPRKRFCPHTQPRQQMTTEERIKLHV